MYSYSLKASISCVIFLSLGFLSAIAQEDTLRLAQIEVYGNRFEIPDHVHPSTILRITLSAQDRIINQSLGDLLSRKSGIIVRSYGSGTVQTMSARGFNSTQNQILWNGMSLNHAMIGVTDLSLIPSTLLTEISIVSGSGSAEYGPSAMGTTLSLDTRLFHDEISMYAQTGSFGQKIMGVNLSDTYKKIKFQTGIHIVDEINNYPYLNTTANPPRVLERSNNERSGISVIHNMAHTTSRMHAEANIWFTQVDNNIPGSVISGLSQANQYDQVFRQAISLNVLKGEWRGRVAQYYQNHHLNYTDPLYNITSTSTTHSFRLEPGISYRFSDGLISLLTGFGYAGIQTSEYVPVNRKHGFGQVNARWTYQSLLRIYSSLRVDAYDQFGEAISGSLGFNHSLWNSKIFLKGMAAHSFSPPTFNDLYWPLLGNSSLIPETSDKYELGMGYFDSNRKLDITTYRAIITDGIQWLPDSNGQFRPSNIRKIQSAGWDVNAELKESIGFMEYRLHASGTMNNVINARSRFPNDNAFQKQVIYTPKLSYQFGLSAGIDPINAGFELYGESKRFTTDDHSRSIPAYMVADLTLTGYHRIKQYQLTWSASVKNIQNVHYETIAWYPMPGRSFHIGFQLTKKTS